MAPLQGKCPRRVGFGDLALEIARHPLAQSQACPGAKGKKWTPPHGGLLYTRGCPVGCPVLALLFPYHVNQRLSRAAHPFTRCQQMALDPSLLGFSQRVFKIEF